MHSVWESTGYQNILGMLGISGLTVYFGLEEVGEIKKGDFVVLKGHLTNKLQYILNIIIVRPRGLMDNLQ